MRMRRQSLPLKVAFSEPLISEIESCLPLNSSTNFAATKKGPHSGHEHSMHKA